MYSTYDKTVSLIRASINSLWNPAEGCQFIIGNARFRVMPSNKWDVWATKLGTAGKTRKTKARFSVQDPKNPHILDVDGVSTVNTWQ